MRVHLDLTVDQVPKAVLIREVSLANLYKKVLLDKVPAEKECPMTGQQTSHVLERSNRSYLAIPNTLPAPFDGADAIRLICGQRTRVSTLFHQNPSLVKESPLLLLR